MGAPPPPTPNEVNDPGTGEPGRVAVPGGLKKIFPPRTSRVAKGVLVPIPMLPGTLELPIPAAGTKRA